MCDSLHTLCHAHGVSDGMIWPWQFHNLVAAKCMCLCCLACCFAWCLMRCPLHVQMTWVYIGLGGLVVLGGALLCLRCLGLARCCGLCRACCCCLPRLTWRLCACLRCCGQRRAPGKAQKARLHPLLLQAQIAPAGWLHVCCCGLLGS